VLYLLLTILSSSSIAVILKINSRKHGEPLVLLAGNYFSASILSLILLFTEKTVSTSIELIPLGAFLSILFVGSIFAFSKSVTLSGAALSTVSSRLSVLVPILLSTLFFNELPTVFQLIGLGLTITTIILFYFSISEKSIENYSKIKFKYLILVLAGIGLADFFMKVFQENWTLQNKPWFLFWIFFFSFLITLTLAIRKKNKIKPSTMYLGLLMGIPNIFSSYFLIESLKMFKSVIVYPVVNIGIILFTGIIVKIFWHEHWNNYSKIAMIVGLLSIVFLSI
jgi:drug/metabolite transporter (DMT)-like permease